jgi:N-acetylglucosamine-6-phosphate deacetylase
VKLYGRAFADGAVRDAVTVEIDGPRIAAVRVGEPPPADAERIAGILVPGFVDLHVHGGAGADFMDGTVEAARRICAFHARHGTVALAATTLSAPRAEITAAIVAAAAVAGDPHAGEARIAGIHLEGPYLNAAKAGAQDPAALRGVDRAEVEEWLAAAGDLPVTMTVAPEVPGVMELIAALAHRVTFSIGHTEADEELTQRALGAGARRFTHLWNAMPPLHHRRPGVVGAALASDATLELIADGRHVHPLLLAACARLASRRVVLITDAMRAAGMPDGRYSLARLEVEVRDGCARLANGALAGSLLTMDAAVRTMVREAGLPLAQVLPLASEVPARALGLEGKAGIASGADADLVELDGDLQATRVWIDGEAAAAASA